MTISRSTPCFKRRKIFQLRHSQQITVADLVFENTELKKYLLPKRGVNQDTIMYASRGGGWGGGTLISASAVPHCRDPGYSDVTHGCGESLVRRAEFAEARRLLDFNLAVQLPPPFPVPLLPLQLPLHLQPQERLWTVHRYT